MAIRSNPVVGADDDDRQDGAACRSVDANMFFPRSTGVRPRPVQAAKAFCRAGAVQRDCLEFALETNQEDGV